MRRILCLSIAWAIAAIVPASAPAAGPDYEWALPEWRSTFAAPRLADNRGFVVQATDDAIYVAGVAGAEGFGAGDAVVLRYTLDGRLVWSRMWGGLDLDQAHDMAVAGQNIWIAGSHQDASGSTVGALLRLTTGGQLQTARTYDWGVATLFQSVEPVGSGVVVGGFTHPVRANRDAVIASIDSAGVVEWTSQIEGGGWSEIWDIEVTPEGDQIIAAGYDGADGAPSQALLRRVTTDGTLLDGVTFGGESNDEARAIQVTQDAIYVTGGSQSGRSTDVFLARFGRDLTQRWLRTTGGQVVGGGGYGIALGQRGIYVAGGTYDFPAGGDSALMRFGFDGTLEWTHVAGLPGFWDWNFDIAVRDGRLYTTGVLWQPGLEWYRITTLAYREDFPTATLTRVARWVQDGNDAAAARAMEHFSFGDFQRWAQDQDPSSATAARAQWEGASDSGRAYGRAWIDTSADPPAGEENFVGAITSLQRDVQSGNYALVRDYTGVRISLMDGFIRAQYYISHDRLIPQGGYVFVGEVGIGIPPPPV